MSDIDYLEQLPKVNGDVSTENNFTLAEDERSALDEESKIKLIELLKHEDAATVSEIVGRFKNGDKEAAEILVRTFYPYVESLLVALEKRDLQERASERGGIAPALISSGSRRRDFLSSFFVDFVNKAAEADFSKGIRLYFYSHCVDSFSKRIQASLGLSKNSSENVNAKEDSKERERSLFLDDEPNHNASSSGNYRAQEHVAENKSSLFFEDIPKPKMRISGIPATRSVSNKESSVAKEGSSNQNAKVGGVKGPVYVRQSDSLAGSIAARATEVRRSGLGINAPSGKAQLMRSESGTKNAIQRTSRNNVHLAPALSPSEDVPEKEAAPSAVPAPQSQLTRKAQVLVSGLKKLAATDLEAYRTVVMRYFANCSFAELCQKLEVTSAGEIGLRLLRGLLSLGGDQRSAL